MFLFSERKVRDMPKVYITQEQRDREKLKKVIRGRMSYRGIKQKEVADQLHTTQQNISHKLNNGNITLMEFISLHRIIGFTDTDINELLGKLGGFDEI